MRAGLETASPDPQAMSVGHSALPSLLSDFHTVLVLTDTLSLQLDADSITSYMLSAVDLVGPAHTLPWDAGSKLLHTSLFVSPTTQNDLYNKTMNSTARINVLVWALLQVSPASHPSGQHTIGLTANGQGWAQCREIREKSMARGGVAGAHMLCMSCTLPSRLPQAVLNTCKQKDTAAVRHSPFRACPRTQTEA